MTQKSMAYDNAAYVSRLSHAFGQNTAGASTAFSKFNAFTNLHVYSVAASAIIAAVGTQTSWNGTGTVVAINADTFNVIQVNNGSAITTATHGPFNISTGTNTVTSTVGMWTRVQLSGNGTGNVQAGSSTADGGIALQPGDTLHILRGTDTTGVSAFALEYTIDPNSLVSN
jgi:hypothetical protein